MPKLLRQTPPMPRDAAESEALVQDGRSYAPQEGLKHKHKHVARISGYPYLIGLHDQGIYVGHPLTDRHSPLCTRRGLRQATALSVPLVDQASYSKERSRLRRLSGEKQTYLGASTLYVVLRQPA